MIRPMIPMMLLTYFKLNLTYFSPRLTASHLRRRRGGGTDRALSQAT